MVLLVNRIGVCTVSCVLVLITQFTLSLVPRFFSNSPFLFQLSLSGLMMFLVLGFGKCSKRMILGGVHSSSSSSSSSSAPAFVFFSLCFIWGVYVFVLRHDVSFLMDLIFNAGLIILILALYIMLSSDPGFVTFQSTPLQELGGVEVHDETSLLLTRVRYCKICKVHVKGFDHHCPAFGNCIGQNNYFLFILLLLGFIIAEVFYIAFSSRVARKFQIFNKSRLEVEHFSISSTFALLLQRRLQQISMSVLWQVVFLTWHIYCICFNIRTDEWINWKKYPEFHISNQSSPGESISVRFRNPYDKGFLQNLMEFLRY
ncbi:hypothetical protein ACFE04_015162 [Oxalis oulophora]